MYNGKIYSYTEMKKMNTLRLFRLFQAVGFGDDILSIFDIYDENERGQKRSFMANLIETRFESMIVKALIPFIRYIKLIKPEVQEKSKVRQAGHVFELVKNKYGYQYFKPIVTKLEQWWVKNGNPNAPMPTKGRIPEFSYEQILEMYRLDAMHVSAKEIAAKFQTTYMNVYQIVSGVSCKWAMV